jgi:hypothetical protein
LYNSSLSLSLERAPRAREKNRQTLFLLLVVKSDDSGERWGRKRLHSLSIYISVLYKEENFPLGKTHTNTRENNTKAHADVHLSKTRGLSLREEILLVLLFERYCVSSSDFFVLFFFFMGRTGGVFRRQIVVVVVIVWKNVYDDDCGCGGERSASHSSSSS